MFVLRRRITRRRPLVADHTHDYKEYRTESTERGVTYVIILGQCLCGDTKVVSKTRKN